MGLRNIFKNRLALHGLSWEQVWTVHLAYIIPILLLSIVDTAELNYFVLDKYYIITV